MGSRARRRRGTPDPQQDDGHGAALLQAVALAAGGLFQAPSWDEGIGQFLEQLGRAAGAGRAYVCENVEGQSGPVGTRIRHEWTAPGVISEGEHPELEHRSYEGFERWERRLRRGESIRGRVADCPPTERSHLTRLGVLSIAVVPIQVRDRWWGYLGFDRSSDRRVYTDADVEAMRVGATIIGAAVDHQLSEEAREESEERYRRLIELSPFAILVHQQGLLVFANPAAAKLIRATSAEELVGRSVLELVHSSSRPQVLTRLQRLREGYQVQPAEEVLVRLDGTTVEVETVAAPLVLGGKPAVQVMVRDISEAKRLERALRTHNEYLEALHQMTLGLIRRLDPQEVLEAIVARAGSLVGTEHGFVYLIDHDLGEMEVRVGVGTFSHWMGFRLGRGEGVSGKVWETGEPVVVEDYDTWAERSSTFPKGVFHAVVAVPLHSRGEMVGVLGLAHVEPSLRFGAEAVDMLDRFAELASIAFDNARLYSEAQQELVERRRAEQALRFQAHLLDNVENAVVATDANDAISYWNAFAERLLGWKAEEVLGRHIRKFLRVPPEVIASVNEVTDAGRAWSGDFEIRRRDGSSFVAFGRVSPVHAQDGTREGLVGVFMDITDRRRTEEALRAAFEREKEVSQRLLAVDEMKTTFLEAVSHELRTPLSAILGLALTLERYDERFSPERTREMIGRLAVNARKLDRLLSDLLDLDRLSRGILKPRRRPTDFSALVRQVVVGSDVADDRPIQLKLADVIVPVEPAKVERIVENLIANAVRHTPEGTPIWIRVEEAAQGVVIAVEDAGPGVPRELRETIFEAFRQGTDRGSASHGVGIGLSLVARFAELHGGRAWVEDRRGGGASFRVFFPTTVPEGDAAAS